MFEKEDNVGLITLNRPAELNALDYPTLCQLGEIIAQIGLAYKEIRSVVIRAAGRAFCAGADLKERRTLNEQQVRRNVNKIREVFDALARLPQPTIAAINGYAFGGGFELALACDFRYAWAGATLGLTEVSLGIIPGAGGTQRLPRLIGPALAKELILTGRRISATEAQRLGILNGVAETVEQLDERCRQLCSELSNNAPLAVYQAKDAIDRGLNVDLMSGMEIEAKAYEAIIPTKDRIEALEAFRAKRKPIFRGE
nr:enoyl-CoA hydratase-related protein [Brevibacillus fulvus]